MSRSAPVWHGSDIHGASLRALAACGSVVWSWNVVGGTRVWGYWSDVEPRPHIREGERLVWSAKDP